MGLPASALVSVKTCASLMHVTAEDSPETELPGVIQYASAAIINYCGWPVIRNTEPMFFDSYGDGKIIVRRKPVLSITSVRYDTSYVFGDDTELTDYKWIPQRSTIYLGAKNDYAEAAYRVVMDNGYTRVDHRGEAPDDYESGDTWFDGTVFRIRTTTWEDYNGEPMPEDLEGACVEYVNWLRARFASGGAGIVKKERGYSFEGSAVQYEIAMPSHVAERLAPYSMR